MFIFSNRDIFIVKRREKVLHECHKLVRFFGCYKGLWDMTKRNLLQAVTKKLQYFSFRSKKWASFGNADN